MRLAFVITSLLVGSAAFANCLGEAQIDTTVASVEMMSTTKCKVQLVPTWNIQDNQLCPLDIDEVLSKGVTVGFDSNGACEFKAGEKFARILVLTSSGDIVIE